jgi:hypothetical protein
MMGDKALRATALAQRQRILLPSRRNANRFVDIG